MNNDEESGSAEKDRVTMVEVKTVERSTTSGSYLKTSRLGDIFIKDPNTWP